MANTISAQAHISIYKAGQLGTPYKELPIQEVYQLIQNDESVQKVTNFIRRKHGKGMEDGFKTVLKASYQAHKKQYLEAVTFTGRIDRSAGQKPAIYHNGRLCLDIDENPKEDLKLFRRLCKGGHFPYFEAVGRSISGHINGSLWANVLIEIPEDIQHDYDKLEAIHKDYHSAITYALSKIVIVDIENTDTFPKGHTVIRLPLEELHLLGIHSGHRLSIKVGTSNDLKRARYITHDSDLILQEAKPVTYQDLQTFKKHYQHQKKVDRMTQKAVRIVASDMFDFCHQFAVGKGYDYVDGQKQEYLARFCISAVLLGIPEDVTRTFLLDNIHPKEDGDFIRYPYRHYKDNFGIWKNKVKLSQKDFLPMKLKADTFMTFTKYLEDSPDFDKLLNRISELDRSLLVVPTGSGKTFSSVNSMRERFKAQYPDKTFILLTPLKAITEQVGIDTDLQIICEGHTSFRQATFEDSICTVKSFVDWSESLHEEDLLKNIVLVFDEAHELINASSYQPLGTLPYLFEKVFKVIGLTATPLTPLISHYGFTPIRCDRTNNPAVNIAYKRITQDQLYKTVLTFGKTHRTSKNLYFYNDKKSIEKLSMSLKRRGMKSDFFHAGMKKKSGTYSTLINTGKLPEGTDHLFSTKILGFGTSFKGLDNIVYITRKDNKDFLEFMQSYARLREEQINVTVIIVEPKTESERKHRQYDFDMFHFQKERERLQKVAEEIRQHDINRLKYASNNAYKNSIPTELNRLIKHNKLNGQYYVDTLQLFCEQYQKITRSITGEDFLQFLRLIPNVSIVSDQQEAVLSAQEQKIIDEVDQQYKEQEEADTEAIKELLTTHKDEVFKHIHTGTEDYTLKDKIKEHLPLIVEKLQGEDRELIDRRFQLTEKAVRRYISLSNDYKDQINHDKLLEYCFLQNRPYGRLRRQLNSLYNVQLHEEGKQKGAEYSHAKGLLFKKTTEAHLQLIAYFERIQDQKPVVEVFNDIQTKDWFKVLKLNSRTWTEEVGFFFDIKRTRNNRQRSLYVGNRLTICALVGDNIGIVMSKRIAV